MTPERTADLVARWVRLYTRNLPAPIAERRIEEIDADVHDHIAHERAHGTGERRISMRIAGRMLRGAAADTSWRRRALARASDPGETRKMSRTAQRSALRVGLATAFAVLLPLVATQLTDEMNWSVFDFALVGVLVAASGLLLELAARKPRNVAFRFAAAVIGAAAIVLGEADDAPGLVLFGCLLVGCTLALTFRTAQRST